MCLEGTSQQISAPSDLLVPLKYQRAEVPFNLEV